MTVMGALPAPAGPGCPVTSLQHANVTATSNHPPSEGDARAAGSPTPIWISPRTRSRLVLAGIVALLLVLYLVPTVVTLVLGGAALALVLSFPVRALSRVVPHGVAILLSFVVAVGLVVLALAVVVPLLFDQLAALVKAIPGIAERVGERIPSLSARLAERGLLTVSPEQFVSDLQRNATQAVENFARGLLGGLGRFITSTIGVAIKLFGIVFVAVYMLADARPIKAALIRTAPRDYRHDVRDLWDSFAHTLSRYLGGLALSLTIQGALSALALFVLGVPYAFLLGVWVAVTAVVPYVGAWIGAIPAVLVALSVSPTTAVLAALLFLVIQQLESNVLTPRIQGEAVRVHPILIFLAAIAGGELAGIPGVVFAVPTVAVLRVLFDFFRRRLRTRRHATAVPT